MNRNPTVNREAIHSPQFTDNSQIPIRNPLNRRCRTGGWAACTFVLIVTLPSLRAQDNYEIQVYGSETVPRGMTMVELHSNFTSEGVRPAGRSMLSSHHALHETVEITRGFTDWFETGFYFFTSVQPGRGWEWVGDHIRPRVRVPESWHWPVGLSLSTEFGYKRRAFSDNTWNWEIRPIIDKEFGRWYVSLNPTVGKVVHGPDSNQGFELSPSIKIAFDLNQKIAVGIEYYADLGPITRIAPWREQGHTIYPTLDLNLSPRWEINFGVGIGLTQSTDSLNVKLILGRRF